MSLHVDSPWGQSQTLLQKYSADATPDNLPMGWQAGEFENSCLGMGMAVT
jgi:hypothetical protein